MNFHPTFVKAILSEYCKFAIEVSFRLYPIGCKEYPKAMKLYPIRYKLKKLSLYLNPIGYNLLCIWNRQLFQNM